jgi:SET domain-containing protein
MMLVRTYVAPSAISGLGAFASHPIAKGMKIWRFEPKFDRLLHKSMLQNSPEFMAEYLRDYAYPHPEKPDWYIVEIDNGRFINHNDRPNTDFSGVFDGYAKRDIRAGEELTANYAEFDINFQPGEFDLATQTPSEFERVTYIDATRRERTPRRSSRTR